jgi:hypothetical protein
MAIKTSKKEEKSLEQAKKDAEMVSELAKDARNRREAKTISDKLESEIESNEGNQINRNNISLSAEQQEHAIENVLNETKDNIRLTTREAAKEIPQYTRMLGDIQEETVKTMREIADNYIESQKEIINLYQSVWTPLLENVNNRFWNYWWISPKGLAETYGTVVSSFADNVISATKLTNNATSANMGLFRIILQQSKYNSEEFSRLGVKAAKVFKESSNEIANSNLFQLESTGSNLRK